VDENSERTAQAIASGQLPAPTGMALLNPKNQRILGRVMEINPQYDATTVSAKKAAATAFTSGKAGNACARSPPPTHLDQLGELADALDNGNMQVVNKVANYFSSRPASPK
jgi:type II secretory pathway component GspD/PulD (secretin)